MKNLLFILTLAVLPGAQAQDNYDDYYHESAEEYYEEEYVRPKKHKKKRRTTPLNNWNDSIHRWRRGRGAWDNWRDWRSPLKDGPWSTAGDASADMFADAMGDMVADVEFNIWLDVNIDIDYWHRMKKRSKIKTYDYWKEHIEPYD